VPDKFDPLYGDMNSPELFASGAIDRLLPKSRRKPRTTNAQEETKMAAGGVVDTFWYPQVWEDIMDLL
jgi:hypothetical protein